MARKKAVSGPTITIGIRIEEDGLQFFGTDEVNARIAAGEKVLRVDPGNAIVEAMEDEDGTEDYALVGCDLTVIFAPKEAASGE